jgi:L1 cell adhesion molecule like protein
LKNENIPVEMIEIQEATLKKYVPVLPVTEVNEKTKKEVAVDRLHSILFTGDQLTMKRAESAKESRKNSLNPLAQLKGLIPIYEDWHAKHILLEIRYWC